MVNFNEDILAKLSRDEIKRSKLHSYIEMKLEEKDYHGIADAAMDLRELEERVKIYKELMQAQLA